MTFLLLCWVNKRGVRALVSISAYQHFSRSGVQLVILPLLAGRALRYGFAYGVFFAYL